MYYKKIFYYKETKLPVIKYRNEIWVRAKTAVNILRYKNTMKSIREHVDPENKKRLSELGPKSKQNETFPLEKSPIQKPYKYIYIEDTKVSATVWHLQTLLQLFCF